MIIYITNFDYIIVSLKLIVTDINMVTIVEKKSNLRTMLFKQSKIWKEKFKT